VVENKLRFLQLNAGASFGEESVLLNIPSGFNVRVMTKYASVYCIKKHDFLKLIPYQTIENMKLNFKLKVKSRFSMQQLKSLDTVRSDIRKMDPCPLATDYAKKRLMHSAYRKRIAGSSSSSGLLKCNSVKLLLSNL
jgi:CRP-like cAMP-binding protein